MILGLDLAWIANACGASSARVEERIQSLWSGYGEIVRVGLDGAEVASVVVKVVRPPRARGRDEGHARKCRSYTVETAWYGGLAKRCDATCRVPRL